MRTTNSTTIQSNANYLSNITIATFAESSLYKHEAYNPSLYAGAILNAHGLPVAYKSVSKFLILGTLRKLDTDFI